MKTHLRLALGLAILGGGGCSTTRTLSVVPSGQTTAISGQGVPCLRSAKTNVVTVWLVTSKYQHAPGEFNPPVFHVEVNNGGDRAFGFSTDSIAASSGTSSVHVITPEEYRREISRRAAALLDDVDLRMAKELAGQEALREYGYLYAPRTVRGANGVLLYDFSWQQTDSMTAAKARIQEAGEAQRAAIQALASRLLENAQMMLTQATVAPGLIAGGIVKLEPGQIHRGEPLRLVITAGGEAHEFLFDVGS